MRTLLASFLLSLVVISAQAAEPKHMAPASSTGGGGNSLMALGVADTSEVTAGQSLSALFSTTHDWIQVLAGVNKTKGDFDFAVGGFYKFTLVGDRRTGFHVGPGATLGTINGKFAFAVMGVAGGHYTFAEHFMVAVDAGPMLTHTEDNTNFKMRTIGDVLGASVHYLF